jgi:hypothetical protein
LLAVEESKARAAAGELQGTRGEERQGMSCSKRGSAHAAAGELQGVQ